MCLQAIQLMLLVQCNGQPCPVSQLSPEPLIAFRTLLSPHLLGVYAPATWLSLWALRMPFSSTPEGLCISPSVCNVLAPSL